VDGTGVKEYILALIEAKVGIALKVSLSFGNKGKVYDGIPYLIISVNVPQLF
jgi:hypothetical protein